MTTIDTAWISGCDTGTCVEANVHRHVVYLRDSTQPDVVLTIDRHSWDTFVTAVKAGRFDGTSRG